MHGQKTKNKNLVKKDRLRKKESQKSESKNVKIKLPEDSTENWPIPSSQKDELQLIQGIGLATETALNKIGILKFADFQNFTPATLSKTLEEKTGTSILVADIERNDWIGHTSRLAKEYTIDNSYEEIMETDSHQENNLPTKNSDKLKERSQTTQGVVRQPNASQKVSENSTEGLKKITGETTMSEKSERNKAQKSTKEANELGASGQIAKQENHSKELKIKHLTVTHKKSLKPRSLKSQPLLKLNHKKMRNVRVN